MSEKVGLLIDSKCKNASGDLIVLIFVIRIVLFIRGPVLRVPEVLRLK